MKSGPNPFEGRENGFTYMPGVGFVPPHAGRPAVSQIRIMGTVICLLLTLYFFCIKIFAVPMTYLLHFFGLDITINRFTGLIILTENSRLVLRLSVYALSLLVVLLLIRSVYHRAFNSAHLFRRPSRGSLPIALPLIAAAGFLGLLAAFGVGQMLELGGLVLESIPASVRQFDATAALALTNVLALALLQELLFRGILLLPLRRYGDGFAVLVSSLLAALCADGLLTGIAAFLYGLAAGYFTIRSGSIHTALAGRLLFEALFYGFQLANGMLAPDTARWAVLIAAALLVVSAVIAYIRFVRLDAYAFRLANSPDGLTLSRKAGAFCINIGFIILVILFLSRIIGTLQIIG